MRKPATIFTHQLVKDSATKALAVVGITETVAAVVGFSMADILPKSAGWLERLAIFAFGYIILCVLVALCSYLRDKNGVNIKVNTNDVSVIVGNLFEETGLKIIPFNERFDTTVDDRVISKSSLNGIFVNRYADLSELKAVLNKEEKTTLSGPVEVDGKAYYPLGTVKPFEDYALVAFTHMDEFDRAHLSRGEYEECLMAMWQELSRVYAGRRIVLPLLGSGITRFDDGCPSDDELLQCILCTLRTSGQTFRDGVEIVLTKKTVDKMRLFEVRQYSTTWR